MACVYILTNPAIPDLVKIGYTAGTAADRAAQISQGTGVPAPYAVAWFCETINAQAAADLERYVHQHCAGNRVNRAREFFQMTVLAAAAVIESIGYRAGLIAITSPEIAARAEQERAARAEQERAQQERAQQERAAAQAKRDTELRIQRQRESSERAREAHKAREENQKTATWFFIIGALLLLSPVWFIGLILIVVAWMLHPNP